MSGKSGACCVAQACCKAHCFSISTQRDALAGEKSRFAQEEERLRRQLAEKRVELERLTDQVDLAREQSQAWERQAMEARQALADRIRADNERAGHRAVVEVQTELGDGVRSQSAFCTIAPSVLGSLTPLSADPIHI